MQEQQNANLQGHIVMAWEYGAGLGHVSPLHALALGFSAAGWRVSMVLSNLEAASHFPWPQGVTLWQAPIFRSTKLPPNGDQSAKVPTFNMSSLLLGCGWRDPEVLGTQVRGWMNLINHLQPTLVLCDYAPAAAWVARGLRIPVANVGILTVPVSGQPMPPLRWWAPATSDQCKAHDQLLLETVSEVSRCAGMAHWNRASEAWDADLQVLSTLPALGYGGSGGKPRECWGLLAQYDLGAPPVWPSNQGAKVFVYVQPLSHGFELLLNALVNLHLSAIVVAPGVSEQQIARWKARGVSLVSKPLNMRITMAQASLVVCEGNHGVMAAALCNGLPMLALPNNFERRSNSMSMRQAGAGLIANKGASSSFLEALLTELLENPAYRLAAQGAAAQPVAKRTVQQVTTRIVQACELWRRAP